MTRQEGIRRFISYNDFVPLLAPLNPYRGRESKLFFFLPGAPLIFVSKRGEEFDRVDDACMDHEIIHYHQYITFLPLVTYNFGWITDLIGFSKQMSRVVTSGSPEVRVHPPLPMSTSIVWLSEEFISSLGIILEVLALTQPHGTMAPEDLVKGVKELLQMSLFSDETEEGDVELFNAYFRKALDIVKAIEDNNYDNPGQRMVKILNYTPLTVDAGFAFRIPRCWQTDEPLRSIELSLVESISLAGQMNWVFSLLDAYLGDNIDAVDRGTTKVAAYAVKRIFGEGLRYLEGEVDRVPSMKVPEILLSIARLMVHEMERSLALSSNVSDLPYDLGPVAREKSWIDPTLPPIMQLSGSQLLVFPWDDLGSCWVVERENGKSLDESEVPPILRDDVVLDEQKCYEHFRGRYPDWEESRHRALAQVAVDQHGMAKLHVPWVYFTVVKHLYSWLVAIDDRDDFVCPFFDFMSAIKVEFEMEEITCPAICWKEEPSPSCCIFCEDDFNVGSIVQKHCTLGAVIKAMFTIDQRTFTGRIVRDLVRTE